MSVEIVLEMEPLSPVTNMDEARAEIERLAKDADTWRSNFAEIALRQVNMSLCKDDLAARVHQLELERKVLVEFLVNNLECKPCHLFESFDATDFPPFCKAKYSAKKDEFSCAYTSSEQCWLLWIENLAAKMRAKEAIPWFTHSQ